MNRKIKKILSKEIKKNINSFFEDDVEFAIQINRWLLKPLGIWPFSSSSSYLDKLLGIILMAICSFLLAFIIIPGSLFTFIKIKDPAVRLKLIGALSFCVMAIMKYIFLINGQLNVLKCLEHMCMDWKNVDCNQDRNTMILYAKYGRYGSLICVVFMYAGGVFYAGILPHVTGSIKNEYNVTIRPLAYPSYFILFESRDYYEIIYIIHCLCALVMHSITCAACSLAVVFVMHACGQLVLLKDWLRNLIDAPAFYKTSYDDRFANIVEQHVRALR